MEYPDIRTHKHRLMAMPIKTIQTTMHIRLTWIITQTNAIQIIINMLVMTAKINKLR